MLIYNGQIIAGGGTIVLPMTRAEYEANKAILDNADVWVDLTDEPDQVATADQIAYSVDGVQKGMGYIGDIATKAVAKVEPTDTALYLHEVGEYFINKDGDACKVDLQIPVDGTISLGTNCHVLPKGVANDINSNLIDILPITLPSTGTIPANDAVAKSEDISANIPTGYTYIGVIPNYTGDNRFCFSKCTKDSTNTVDYVIRNVTSVASSGTPKVTLILKKN